MYRLINDDCLEYLKTRPSDKIHAVVCDPPYGLSREPNIEEVLQHWLAGDDYEHRSRGFMGKEWDSFVPGPATWREVFRVLKPGGHALVFAGTRTVDLMTIALRLAGFEIHDGLDWLYGEGMPKGQAVDKMIDKQLGHVRDRKPITGGIPSGTNQLVKSPEQNERATSMQVDEPISDEAKAAYGWETRLKPMREPIILARKPLEGKMLASGKPSTKTTITVADNFMKHGVGALNVHATMIPTSDDLNGGTYSPGGRGDGVLPGNPNGWGDATGMFAAGKGRMPGMFVQPPGRHPGNVILTHHESCMGLNEVRVIPGDVRAGTAAFGTRPAGFANVGADNGDAQPNAAVHGATEQQTYLCHPDCPIRMLDAQAGKPVSRFFYHAKASRKERDAGCDNLPIQEVHRYGAGLGEGHDPNAPALNRNPHPTVKPIELMRWLVRMICPPGGVVLDPFMGSGTTGVAALLEGFNFVGIEREPGYVVVAEHRIAHWLGLPKPGVDVPEGAQIQPNDPRIESTVLAIAGQQPAVTA